MIEEARTAVARTVNAGMTMLYWRIGKRIHQEVLKGKRADYGAEIVSALARQLMIEYGKGFSRDNLFRMIQFAERFSCSSIVGALSRQLTWSHFVELIPLSA